MTDDKRLEILSLAADIGFDGSGGNCGAAAIAINDVLFKGRGSFLAAVNKTLFDEGHIAGHIAVLYNDIVWDYEGTYEGDEGIEDFRSWGMVDPDDPSYNISPIEAEQAIIVPLSRNDLVDLLTTDMLTLSIVFDTLLKSATAQIIE